MPESLLALALLACPLGMGAMMWVMMRKQDVPATSEDAAKQADIAALQAQVDRLQTQQRDADWAGNSPR